MFHKLIKGIAPVAAIALSAALAGCGDMNVSIDGESGVPLAELDMSGEAPTELVLAGPDTVIVNDGSALDIDVSGDDTAIELVRFTLKDGTLGVLRARDDRKNSGRATVTITMPSPRSITIAGSGSVEAESMSEKADINILGSGDLKVGEIDANSADVNVAGSGKMEAAGRIGKLDLNVMGAGKADMSGVSVDNADVTIAGSGDSTFKSDGTVDATIMGSGTVRVIGRAKCEVNSMGSGKIICEVAEDADEAEEVAAAETKAKKAKKPAKKKLAKKKTSPKKPRKA